MLGLSLFRIGGKNGKASRRPGAISLARHIIERACRRSVHTEVTVKGTGKRYGSFFVAMNPARSGEFYLDALAPHSMHEFLTPGVTVLELDFDIRGTRYQLESLYRGIELYEGFHALRLEIPPAIRETQRREAYRVRPRITDPARLELANGEKINLHDISGRGVSFTLDRKIAPGQMLAARLRLPGERAPLNLKIEVVACEPRNNHGVPVAPGMCLTRGKFAGLSLDEERRVYSYVLDRERELLRVFG